MQYFYTARFLRSLKRCPEEVQEAVIESVHRFEKDRANTKLHLHKLNGKFKNYHAFSANFTYRIIVKIAKHATYYMDVGTHDIYA